MLEYSSGSGTWAEDLLGVARSLSPSKEGVSPSKLNSIPFHKEVDPVKGSKDLKTTGLSL